MSIYALGVRLERNMDLLEEQFQISARITDRPPQWQNTGHGHAIRPVAGGSSQTISRVNVAQASIEPSPNSPSYRFIPDKRADKDLSLSSWDWIKAYPDHFIGKANKPLAQPFFDNLTEHGPWSFFYIYDPEKPGRRHLLVLSSQFEDFLAHINRSLGIKLSVPARGRDKYYMKFGEGDTPRPRYLKRIRHERTLNSQSWPPRRDEDVKAFQSAKFADQAIMRDKLMMMDQAHTSSATITKQTKAQQQAEKREARRAMLEEVQQYLHLRGGFIPDVVFVCMDVEALEFPPNSVTEVGISILDSRYWYDDPNVLRHDWFDFIKSYHMRIREHANHRNGRYVQGCPDKFDFGTSTFPRGADVAYEIEAVLKPYMAHGRQLVFVGHDGGHDIEYLKQVGFNVLSMKGLRGQCDTKDMYRAWKGINETRSLGSILDDLHIDHRNLHNAGNDAAYTLCAMIGIAVQDLRDKGQLPARGPMQWPRY